MPELIAVDWGTSSLRGARLDGAGKVLDEKSAPLGILNVPNGDYAGVFEAQFADWMKEGARCLISGMAGSRQGWAEAPYVRCPAGPDELAKHLHWVGPGRIALVPGLSDEQGDVPDVMRGEEVQIFGALSLLDLDDGVFVLPGTHSKWAEVRGGAVQSFRTCMTGEVYALLRQHSILARTLPPEDGPLQEAEFLQGVRHARAASRLPAAQASYLSGLVIGEELRAQGALPPHVVLIGSGALTRRYTLALGELGTGTRSLGSEATWRGLRALASTLESP